MQPYSVGSLFPALWEAHSRRLVSQGVERVPTKRRRGKRERIEAGKEGETSFEGQNTQNSQTGL